MKSDPFEFRTKEATLSTVCRVFPISPKIGQACGTPLAISWGYKSNKIPQKPIKMPLEAPRSDMPAWGGGWVAFSGCGGGWAVHSYLDSNILTIGA